VVAVDERDRQPGDEHVADSSLLDPPRQEPFADAVGGTAAGCHADHPARADRLAVARLEVGAADAEAQVAHATAPTASAAAATRRADTPTHVVFSTKIAAAT